MAEDKMEEISDELGDIEGGGGKGGSIFKKIPVLITGIVVIIVVAYLLVVKVIKPMLTEKPAATEKKIETMKPKDNPQEVIQKTNEGDEIPAEEKEDIQEIWQFAEAFQINPLVDSSSEDESAILVISIALEIDTGDLIEELERRIPQLRDMIITRLSAMYLKDLQKPQVKVRLKNDLKKDFNKILIKGKVVNVFFLKYQYQLM